MLPPNVAVVTCARSVPARRTIVLMSFICSTKRILPSVSLRPREHTALLSIFQARICAQYRGSCKRLHQKRVIGEIAMRAVFVLVLNLLSAFSAAAQTIATLFFMEIDPSLERRGLRTR